MTDRIIVNRHLKQRHPAASVAVPLNRPLALTNGVLMIAVAMLVAYYVVQANLLAALQYDVGASSGNLASLREQSHGLGARVAQAEQPDRLVAYALSHGMILASDASYVASQPGLAGR